MSEIDFEELDKEVNKVMADEDGAGESKKPVEVKVRKVAKPVVRGRYMDMVHPSSDMRPPTRNYATGKKIKMPENDVILEDVTGKSVGAMHHEPNVKKEAETEYVEDEVEFGIIEDANSDNSVEEELLAEEDFVSEPEPFAEVEDEQAPNGNNYSLGGKSPFIPDAKVDKRPLGNHVPEGSERGVHSTKNVYSQRTPVKHESVEVKPKVIESHKKTSGWVWALVTLLVLAAGGGLGVLVYMLYTGW